MSHQSVPNVPGRELRVWVEDAAGERVAFCVVEQAINANTAAPMVVKATVQCDLGHEHSVGEMALRVFSPRMYL